MALHKSSRSLLQNPVVSERGSCVGTDSVPADQPSFHPPLLGAQTSDTPSFSPFPYLTPQLPSARSLPILYNDLGALRFYGAAGRISKISALSDPYACTKRSTLEFQFRVDSS